MSFNNYRLIYFISIVVLFFPQFNSEVLKFETDPMFTNSGDNNTAITKLAVLAPRAVGRQRVVFRGGKPYRPARRRYPKGAIYSRYKTPSYFVTWPCQPLVGLFLCRQKCEERSPNVLGSCDSGYCICLLLKPKFRGKGVFTRRAKCKSKSQRTLCNNYCQNRLGNSLIGLCRGTICRCVTHPAPPKNLTSACKQAAARLKDLENRLRKALAKAPNTRTPADKKLISDVSKSPSGDEKDDKDDEDDEEEDGDKGDEEDEDEGSGTDEDDEEEDKKPSSKPSQKKKGKPVKPSPKKRPPKKGSPKKGSPKKSPRRGSPKKSPRKARSNGSTPNRSPRSPLNSSAGSTRKTVTPAPSPVKVLQSKKSDSPNRSPRNYSPRGSPTKGDRNNRSEDGTPIRNSRERSPRGSGQTSPARAGVDACPLPEAGGRGDKSQPAETEEARMRRLQDEYDREHELEPYPFKYYPEEKLSEKQHPDLIRGKAHEDAADKMYNHYSANPDIAALLDMSDYEAQRPRGGPLAERQEANQSKLHYSGKYDNGDFYGVRK